MNAQPMIPDRSLRPAPGPKTSNKVQQGRYNAAAGNNNSGGAAAAFMGGVIGGASSARR